jgi:TPP-dependent trihydroxycyclohexane-1,2-dione (THcHDO) dehydratase
MNETITLSNKPSVAKGGTVRLTSAQALVRYLSGLRTRLESSQGDEIVPLFGGAFAIFGHGNVAGLGEALYQYRDRLPTYVSFSAHQLVPGETVSFSDPSNELCVVVLNGIVSAQTERFNGRKSAGA